MITRLRSYLAQHHVALLALFLALGGGGAYAATQAGQGSVREFNATPTNTAGTSKATLAKLGGLTLTYASLRRDDARDCRLVAKAGGRGELHSSYVVKASSGSGQETVVGGKTFKKSGSTDVVFAEFAEGVPGISRQAEGQLTWHSSATHQVVTSVFHVSAESKRCAFQGTLSGG